MKKVFKFLSIIFAFSIIYGSSSVCAAENSEQVGTNVSYSYNYNWDNKVIQVPSYYELSSSIQGDFGTAVDMMIYKDKLYVLTAKGIGIYNIASGDFVSNFAPENVDFADAKGFCVTEDKIYLTQYEKKKVLVLDYNGKQILEFGEPNSSVVSEGFIYKPQKIAVQENGLIYVISDGTYDGLLQYNSDGTFIGFFGAEKVTMTAELLLEQLWNKFRTQAQKDRTVLAIPTSYHGLCLTSEDLLYVCSASPDIEELQVKKLSPYGNDITNTSYKTTFGDYTEEKEFYNKFTDVSVNKDGIVSVLDSSNGKIFQYDAENHLMGVFGGISDKTGTFQSPVAIESYGDTVYVLDSGKKAIYNFHPTEYGTLIREGTKLYLDGMISEAEAYYSEIYKITSEIDWVSSGLGQAALERRDYKKGMEYFKAAMNTDGYDQCYEAYRLSIVTEYFWIIFIVIVAAFAGIWIKASRSMAKAETAVMTISNNKIKPWSVLSHPTIFGDMKDEKRGSFLYATIVLLVSVAVRIASLTLKGFLFNPGSGVGKNYIMEIIQFILIFLCFTICVWAVGTFIEGKGKVFDLYISYAYAFVPFCICSSISIILSNVMTLREGAFVTGIETLGFLWTAMLIFAATLIVNEYSFSKTIFSLIGTILAMIFVLFLLIMMATLLGKISSFVMQLIEEIVYKM